MDSKNVGKLTWIVNTAILCMVLGLMLFFHICEATIMVWFSIPTIFVYIIGYVLIYKKKYYFYVWMVYLWITLYMSLATVCLGYKYGFHLYSLSMIPIIYYTNYIAYKINQKRLTTAFFSFVIIACYMACTIYVSLAGSVYEGSNTSEAIFWITNSIIVFAFLILYTKLLIKSIIDSEEKLKEMSYVDSLTGLFNRHYMREQLVNEADMENPGTLAMIDIDDFKQINDIYGHNAGDYVLKEIANIMKNHCGDSIISRWGGEEFLILINGKLSPKEMMEELRATVNNTKFEFDKKPIKVSVTIGVAEKDGETIDRWIQEADKRLYVGKNSGKNVVICN